MSTHLSPRVNSALIANFQGKTVRLPCKVINFSADTATVEASDGGEVLIHLPNVDAGRISLSTYVEVVGTAMDANTIKMITCVQLGNELDMALVDKVIQKIHDPRYFSKYFS